MRVGSTIVKNIVEARKELTRQLHTSVDGDGLDASAAVPFDHSWVSDGTALMTGASFIDAIQIRGATGSTRKRFARGRQQASDKCNACGRVKTLGYILQVCHRTWGPESRGMTRFWRSCSASWIAAAGHFCALRLFL